MFGIFTSPLASASGVGAALHTSVAADEARFVSARVVAAEPGYTDSLAYIDFDAADAFLPSPDFTLIAGLAIPLAAVAHEYLLCSLRGGQGAVRAELADRHPAHFDDFVSLRSP